MPQITAIQTKVLSKKIMKTAFSLTRNNPPPHQKKITRFFSTQLVSCCINCFNRDMTVNVHNFAYVYSKGKIPVMTVRNPKHDMLIFYRNQLNNYYIDKYYHSVTDTKSIFLYSYELVFGESILQCYG